MKKQLEGTTTNKTKRLEPGRWEGKRLQNKRKQEIKEEIHEQRKGTNRGMSERKKNTHKNIKHRKERNKQTKDRGEGQKADEDRKWMETGRKRMVERSGWGEERRNE